MGGIVSFDHRPGIELNTPANKAISITNHASIGMVGMCVWDTTDH